MIQPFQSQSRYIQSPQQPQRQMNQISPYQDEMNRQLMTNPFNNDPFMRDFEHMHNRMIQNFQNMTQIMLRGSPFSGFPSQSLMAQEFDERDVFGFSDLHNQIYSNSNGQQNSGGQFQVFSRSMVQKQIIGPDGQPKVEKYYNDNMIQRGNDGNTISEKKQAYHNQANGRSIMAHERMLNDQGHKYIKERNHLGQIEDQNLYHNITEEQAQDFHQRWNNQSNNMRTLQSNQPSRYMQIQNEPVRQSNQQNQYQIPQIAYQNPDQISRSGYRSNLYERPQLQYQTAQQPITPQSTFSSRSRPQSGYSNNSYNQPQRYDLQNRPISSSAYQNSFNPYNANQKLY
ncbi:hypothetical protein TTHERM_01015990 (macronuclear) [Tetrahymena thermophila SB210]|uniref:Uncharacterized protein n=1 Tax=Tetrahymena thermophila (strain SB210) TaxID=312017 RepID=Q22CU2_TETTS|nr:hypothetical protein TTHERM_01015990 [Tetrahymena thermophila SB210]EAR83096.2 hypothetical protein TTHERM_01015990 [Tetrahymena thermophila SB210]|eukprot:XP_001030759.2 hypothetical protein TTHERM_01015990 [Tetrahymena thermophila SB210]